MLTRKNLIINEDNAHFYISHPPQDMTEEGLIRLVQTYAASENLKAITFNVNVQRALFHSEVWEPLYHDYDPDGPPDQPALQWLPPHQRELRPGCHGRTWVHHLWLLHARGIDHFKVWLEACQRYGVEGWLSVRMNDCHHNDNKDAFWHPTLWRERPDLHRAPYRDEGWFEGAFDYGKPEVFEHHLRLVEELSRRYHFDTLELDWVRWVRHFSPGAEEKNAHILTEFMRQTRRILLRSRKPGQTPPKLAVRLPASLENALTLGYDIPTWAQENLFDIVVLAQFFQQPLLDWQVKLWRSVIPSHVKIFCQPESVAAAHPLAPAPNTVCDYRFHYASAASALQRQADGIYLFNDCYREGPVDRLSKENPHILPNLLHNLRDLETIRQHLPRRHLVSYPQICGPGMPSGAVFPIPLQKPRGAYDFGRHGEFITLRIPCGPLPRHGTSQSLILGFDRIVPRHSVEDFRLWLNTTHVTTVKDVPDGLDFPPNVRGTIAWQIPEDALQADTNIIEILPPKGIEANLIWAEIFFP